MKQTQLESIPTGCYNYCRQLGSHKQDLPSWWKLSLKVIYIQICTNPSENFFPKNTSHTIFSWDETANVGNLEIVAVRKHFNTREIILFHLFCFHLLIRRKKKQKRNKLPAFMSLILLFQERYISGKNFPSFAKGLDYLLLCTCSSSCCCHRHLLLCGSDRSAHLSPPVVLFNWANYVL